MQAINASPATTELQPRVDLAASPRGRLLRAIGLVGALALAMLGQNYLTHREAVLDGVVFYVVAVALAVKLLGPLPMLQVSLAVPRARPWVWRWPWAGTVAVAFGAATFLTAGGNTVRPQTLIAWAIAIGATLYAAADPRPDPRAWATAVGAWLRHPPRALRLPVPWLALVVLAIVALGAFYRYYHLDTMPSDPNSDHAEKLLDVQDVLDGQRPWFFIRNTGREPLQFYLTAPVAAVRGTDYLSLKLITAGLGVLGVLWCFLFARQLFGNAVGLVAAFFFAVGQWEVSISRFGLRYSLGSMCSTLALYLLFRALRTGERRDYLLLGLGIGLGLYGYTPFRLVIPLFVVLALAIVLLIRWREGWLARLDLVRNGALAFVVAGVVFLPLGRYALEYPANFWERSLSRVSSTTDTSPALVFLSNLKNAALMFHWQGDEVWVATIPQAPFLDPIIGGLFLLGIVYAIVRLVRYREWVYGLLLLGLPVLTLASTASIGWPGENPSAVRSGPVIAVVYLLATLPLVAAARQLGTLLGVSGRVVAAGLVAAVLACTAYLNYERYFVTYATQYVANAQNTTEMAGVLRGWAASEGNAAQAFLVGWPHWADTRNVGQSAGFPRWNNGITSPQQLQAAAAGPTPQLYILNAADLADLATLRELHPEGRAQVYQSRAPAKNFVVYFVPGPPG